RPYTDEEMIRRLQLTVSSKLVRGTRLIEVVVENESADLAQKIAQSIVEQYIHRNFEERIGISQDANKFLIEEAERLKAKVQKSEQALQLYKEQNQAVSLESSQNIIVAKLKELNE